MAPQISLLSSVRSSTKRVVCLPFCAVTITERNLNWTTKRSTVPTAFTLLRRHPLPAAALRKAKTALALLRGPSVPRPARRAMLSLLVLARHCRQNPTSLATAIIAGNAKPRRPGLHRTSRRHLRQRRRSRCRRSTGNGVVSWALGQEALCALSRHPPRTEGRLSP